MEKVNLEDKLSQIHEVYEPKIVGTLNGQHVKLAKLHGPFVWHKHDDQDEMFLVVKGAFSMELRDRTVRLEVGEMFIVERGVEHRPVADEEAHVMLFEPIETVSTGDVVHAYTKRPEDLEHL